MNPSRLGRYESRSTAGERYQVYIPPPLPPQPSLVLTPALTDLLERASLALGRLDGLSALLPETSLFLYMYVRKEAVLSSQIEGTQSSLSDLLLYESDALPGVPLDDVEEVSNYVAAMNYGLARLREDHFPLSSRLLREIHGVLMQGARGGSKAPGEFRRSQNWLGGTRPGNALFVPPPFEHLPELLSNLEAFLHDGQERTPTLIKAALAHVQFETLHPFLDGNGRLGRLLITLVLCAEGALEQPLLYLSLYFKQHRAQYYTLLQRVRLEGVWEEWLAFFLEGVLSSAEDAVRVARAIRELLSADRARLERGGGSAMTLRLHALLQTRPLLNVSWAAAQLEVSPPTVSKALRQLEALDMVRELSGRQRGRVWAYRAYLELLSQDSSAL